MQSDRKYKRFRAVQDSDRMFKTDEKKFQNRRENPRTDEKISVVGWDPDQADPPFPISEKWVIFCIFPGLRRGKFSSGRDFF